MRDEVFTSMLIQVAVEMRHRVVMWQDTSVSYDPAASSLAWRYGGTTCCPIPEDRDFSYYSSSSIKKTTVISHSLMP